MVLALAAHWKMKLHQMDIKRAFSNRELTDEVYMLRKDKKIVFLKALDKHLK